jgi:hypothetical protein
MKTRCFVHYRGAFYSSPVFDSTEQTPQQMAAELIAKWRKEETKPEVWLRLSEYKIRTPDHHVIQSHMKREPFVRVVTLHHVSERVPIACPMASSLVFGASSEHRFWSCVTGAK